MMSEKIGDIAAIVFFTVLIVFMLYGIIFSSVDAFTTWGEVQYTNCEQVKDTGLYICEKIK